MARPRRPGGLRRPRGRGQSMVEFALCAPIVFAILFGVINGGLFMYAKNSVARAANVAVVAEAAEGVSTNVDLDALQAMRDTGVGPQSLTGIKWVEFAQVAYSAGSQSYGVVPGCSSGSVAGLPCANRYDIAGNPLWSHTGCADAVYFCPPFPPSARSIHASNASLMRVTIHYTFSFLVTTTSFTLDEVKIYRLEPKDL